MKTLAISFAIGAVVGGSFISSTTTTNKVLNILILMDINKNVRKKI